MKTRQDAIAEVTAYISDKLRAGVNADLLASEIVDDDDGSGHGEVRGHYAASGNPIVVSFDPVE